MKGLRDVLFGRQPSDDERSRKAQKLEDQVVKSHATLARAGRLLGDERLVAELDGAVAAIRRRQ